MMSIYVNIGEQGVYWQTFVDTKKQYVDTKLIWRFFDCCTGATSPGIIKAFVKDILNGQDLLQSLVGLNLYILDQYVSQKDYKKIQTLAKQYNITIFWINLNKKLQKRDDYIDVYKNHGRGNRLTLRVCGVIALVIAMFFVNRQR